MIDSALQFQQCLAGETKWPQRGRYLDSGAYGNQSHPPASLPGQSNTPISPSNHRAMPSVVHSSPYNMLAKQPSYSMMPSSHASSCGQQSGPTLAESWSTICDWHTPSSSGNASTFVSVTEAVISPNSSIDMVICSPLTPGSQTISHSNSMPALTQNTVPYLSTTPAMELNDYIQTRQHLPIYETCSDPALSDPGEATTPFTEPSAFNQPATPSTIRHDDAGLEFFELTSSLDDDQQASLFPNYVTQSSKQFFPNYLELSPQFDFISASSLLTPASAISPSAIAEDDSGDDKYTQGHAGSPLDINFFGQEIFDLSVREIGKVQLRKMFQSKNVDGKWSEATCLQTSRKFTDAKKAIEHADNLIISDHLTHIGEDKYKCRHCPARKDSTRRSAIRHWIEHHNRNWKPYKCRLCKKAFPKKANMERHQKKCMERSSA